MDFRGDITALRESKKTMVVQVSIHPDDWNDFRKHYANFKDRPTRFALLVDAEEAERRMQQITDDQRAKTYALINCYAKSQAVASEYAKEELKSMFISEREIRQFSLSDVDKVTASEFIDWLIENLIEIGELPDSPARLAGDINRVVAITWKKKKCIVCGRDGERHHIEAIGAGQDRRTYDDSKHRGVCLCRGHHSEAHNIGWSEFERKYILSGISITIGELKNEE